MTKTLPAAGLGTQLVVFACPGCDAASACPTLAPSSVVMQVSRPLPRTDTLTSTSPSSFKEKALRPCIYFQTKVNKG